MIPRSLLLGLALAGAASAEVVTLGFDDVSAPGPFAFIVPGFSNGPHLEQGFVTLDGGVILSDALFGQTATSGDNILASCDTCTLGDGSGLPGAISITFAQPAASVSLDVINGVAWSGTFELRAFDADDAPLASASVVLGPSGSPTAVKPLSVAAEGIARVELGTLLPTGYTFAMDTLVVDLAIGTWTDLGQGLGGAAPAPVLALVGLQLAGEVVTLEATGGPPSSTGFLVLGLSVLGAPFKGGTLVPSPDLVVPVPLDPSGDVALHLPWPASAPSGAVTVWQLWAPDASAPAGFVASNAVQGTTP